MNNDIRAALLGDKEAAKRLISIFTDAKDVATDGRRPG